LIAPPPKSVHKNHHVVPVGWQRKFASPNEVGPFYKNVLTGGLTGAIGPGQKMSERYANIVFDERYRPTDSLEDRLGKIETKALPALDRLISTSSLDHEGRVDIAYLLAIQACRYPELFERRLDLGRMLAIAIKDAAGLPDAAAMNRMLQEKGYLPGANFTPADFVRLTNASPEQLAEQVDQVLSAHGYEHFYNPHLVVDAALPIAGNLLGLEWQLLKSDEPAFILSDRPMPYKIEDDGFSLGMTANFGLKVQRPAAKVSDGPIVARAAKRAEIDAINHDVRSRAREWICGPRAWIETF
jgi:hypothetical protein